MLHKLAIGTAQFGLNYGISNADGKSSQNEINSMLDLAASRNVKSIDTAIVYGHSELSIGSSPAVHKGEFQIITKIANTSKQPITYLDESLKKLNVDSIYGLLAHNFELVCENPDYYKKMLLLKQNGKVSKIGVSIYTPTQLEYLIDNNIAFYERSRNPTIF
jgi:diketogulonate reductase-like aldo/keto reductase